MALFDLSNLRVLVAEDSDYMRRIVRAMLNGFGIRHIEEASDGAEALERLDGQPFDIFVVDWEMPVLDGPDVIRLVRTPDHAMAYIPIIMITGHSTRMRTEEAMKLGVHDVLSKPFSPQALYDRILDAIVNPRPFMRTDDYFGPKPRIDKSKLDAASGSPKPALIASDGSDCVAV